MLKITPHQLLNFFRNVPTARRFHHEYLAFAAIDRCHGVADFKPVTNNYTLHRAIYTFVGLLIPPLFFGPRTSRLSRLLLRWKQPTPSSSSRWTSSERGPPLVGMSSRAQPTGLFTRVCLPGVIGVHLVTDRASFGVTLKDSLCHVSVCADLWTGDEAHNTWFTLPAVFLFNPLHFFLSLQVG